ncbi:MAG: hypothetical protein EOM02_08955, partial [Synergistales bacterium]|nr:hypothetical protein [Synergistales bacterium]
MLIDVKGMGLVEFPDSMPLDEIKKAIDTQLSSPDALSMNKADKVGDMGELRERYKETLFDADPLAQGRDDAINPQAAKASLLRTAIQDGGMNLESARWGDLSSQQKSHLMNGTFPRATDQLYDHLRQDPGLTKQELSDLARAQGEWMKKDVAEKSKIGYADSFLAGVGEFGGTRLGGAAKLLGDSLGNQWLSDKGQQMQEFGEKVSKTFPQEVPKEPVTLTSVFKDLTKGDTESLDWAVKNYGLRQAAFPLFSTALAITAGWAIPAVAVGAAPGAMLSATAPAAGAGLAAMASNPQAIKEGMRTLGGLVAQTLTGTAVESLTEAGGVYSEYANELQEKGLPEKEAKKKAQEAAVKTYLKNLMGLATSNALQHGIQAGKLAGDSASGVRKGIEDVSLRLLDMAWEGAEEVMQKSFSETSMGRPFGLSELFSEETFAEFTGGVFMSMSSNAVTLPLTRIRSQIEKMEVSAQKETLSKQRQAFEDIFRAMEEGNLPASAIADIMTETQRHAFVSDAVMEFKNLRDKKRAEGLSDADQAKVQSLAEGLRLLSEGKEAEAIVSFSGTIDLLSWIEANSAVVAKPTVAKEDGGVVVPSDETAVTKHERQYRDPAQRQEATGSAVVPVGEAHRPLEDMTLDNATLYTSSEIEANRNRLERSLGKMTKAQIREQFGVVSNRGDKRDSLISKVIDGLKT